MESLDDLRLFGAESFASEVARLLFNCSEWFDERPMLSRLASAASRFISGSFSMFTLYPRLDLKWKKNQV